MSVIGSNILAGASGQGGGYNLSRSLRFRSSASAYLSRTPASAGNRKTWTWSSWVKFGDISTTAKTLFGTLVTSSYTVVGINSSGQGTVSIGLESVTGTTTVIGRAYTNAVYRDPSAWYHVVVVLDTTQATGSDRFKIYINGVQQTLTFSVTPSQNSDHYWNQASVAQTVMTGYSTGYCVDGYLTEVNFIDGQALTPSSFGETSSTTGVWQPKRYSGTYGTNGFYLPFSDNTSTTTLGADSSGNGNNWTCNNISLTSGSTYDSMTDVPTLTSATASNFCVLNPLQTQNSPSISSANLKISASSAASNRVGSTIAVSSGKWYWEVLQNDNFSGSSGTYNGNIAVFNVANALATGDTATSWCYGNYDGNKVTNNTSTSYGSGATTGDIIMCALDMDNGKIWWGKNGTWFASGNPASGTNEAFSGLSGSIAPSFRIYTESGTRSMDANFGQRPFAYTPPTGYVALNTFNLPTPTIGATASSQANKYFDATLYTGTGATKTVTNSGSMQPDLVWVKVRSTSGTHVLTDSVRGANKQLYSNLTNAEGTATNKITGFTSSGFTLGADDGSGTGDANFNGSTYVGWQWKANGTGVTNTAGSITSTVSANTTSGFSVVSYTGNNTNGATVGHGLGVAPSMVIVKNRSVSTSTWPVWHKSLTAGNGIFLNLTNAQQNIASTTANGGVTSASSTTFTCTNGSTNGLDVNGNGNAMIAYCFAEVAGYSKFGSYTGNGSSDGPFVFTGFRPKYVMVKNTTTGATDWITLDSARDTYNVTTNFLRPNLSNAEGSGSGMLFLSNGFKWQNDTGTSVNQSGANFVYMAFAEVPQKFSLGR